MRLSLDSKALPQYWMANRHFPNHPRPSPSTSLSISERSWRVVGFQDSERSRTTTKETHSGGCSLTWRGWLMMVAIWLCLAGCNNQPAAAHGFPPAEVTVSKPEKKEVVNWSEFTGRTAAVNLVTVTPRVSG